MLALVDHGPPRLGIIVWIAVLLLAAAVSAHP